MMAKIGHVAYARGSLERFYFINIHKNNTEQHPPALMTLTVMEGVTPEYKYVHVDITIYYILK